MKVTGAGGGGHMYVYAEKAKHNNIIKSLAKFGVKKIDFVFTDKGATVFDVNEI